MTYDDAVIQWWVQVHVNHAFSVEQLSTLNLMKIQFKMVILLTESYTPDQSI